LHGGDAADELLLGDNEAAEGNGGDSVATQQPLTEGADKRTIFQAQILDLFLNKSSTAISDTCRSLGFMAL
jgi:hypothetical protein